MKTNRFYNFLNLIGLALVGDEPATTLSTLIELMKNYPSKTNEDSRMFTLLLKIGNTTWNSIYDRFIEPEDERYIFINYCRRVVPSGALDPFVYELIETEALCCIFRGNILVSAHADQDDALLYQYKLGLHDDEVRFIYLDPIDFLKHKQAVAET